MAPGPTCACRFCADLHADLWREVIGRRSTYEDTKIEILVAKNPEFESLYDRVLLWTPTSGKGLVCYGPPGVGKTRICWMLLRRLHDEGVDVCAMSATEFADGVADNYRAGKGPEWIREICSHRILFIDDLDKMVTTDRVQAELFAVLESMTSDGKMLIVTTNCSGADFIAQFAPSVGPAIHRRLAEFCKPASFLRRPR